LALNCRGMVDIIEKISLKTLLEDSNPSIIVLL